MSARARRAAAALRDFARGFLGLASPTSPAAAPRDAAEARRVLAARAARRRNCC